MPVWLPLVWCAGQAGLETSVEPPLLERTPIRGQNLDSILEFGPAQSEVFGATDAENDVFLEGLSLRRSGLGLAGGALSLRFVQRVSVVQAGRPVELAGAMGGVVQVETLRGGDQHRAELFFDQVPLQLSPARLRSLGSALELSLRPEASATTFGVVASGAIIPGELFYSVGFHPQRRVQRWSRDVVRYSREQGEKVACPDYLAGPELCTGGFDSRMALNVEDQARSEGWSLGYFARADYLLSEDQRLTFHALGAPSRFEGIGSNFFDPEEKNGAGVIGALDALGFEESIGVHDFITSWAGAFVDRAFTVHAAVGLHLEDGRADPLLAGPAVVGPSDGALADFEPRPECAREDDGFDPCPAGGYQYNGFGLLRDRADRRWAGALRLAYHLELAGKHELAAGTQVEFETRRELRRFSGGAAFMQHSMDGWERAQHVRFDGASVVTLPQGHSARAAVNRQAVFISERWSPDFLSKLTLTGGVRWDWQQLDGELPEPNIRLAGSFSPRAGAAYDVLGDGRSRIFAHYARYTERLPLSLGRSAFGGDAIAVDESFSSCPLGRQDPRTCTFGQPFPDDVVTSGTGVATVLEAQHGRELVAGAEAAIAGITFGIAWVHRRLGAIIEDVRLETGREPFLANPGAPEDAARIAEHEAEIERINGELPGTSDIDRIAQLEEQKAAQVTEIVRLRAAAQMPEPVRDHDALVISAEKPFGENFILLASYTLSRTRGNHPGLRSDAGLLEPHLSTAYDAEALMLNRSGPLPSDRPHALELRGAYFLPWGEDRNERDGLTIGLAFQATSGTPIDVLGRNPRYGRGETFILPRGAGGRTPPVASLDLLLAYRWSPLEVRLEVFNLLDSRTALSVDEEYTFDRVLPIAGGTRSDLPALRTIPGSQARLNPNYGQPIATQAPLFLRFGIRAEL